MTDQFFKSILEKATSSVLREIILVDTQNISEPMQLRSLTFKDVPSDKATVKELASLAKQLKLPLI